VNRGAAWSRRNGVAHSKAEIIVPDGSFESHLLSSPNELFTNSIP
jgi:hypothetical protein